MLADPVIIATNAVLTLFCSCAKITLQQSDDRREARPFLAKSLTEIVSGAVLCGQPKTEQYRLLDYRLARSHTTVIFKIFCNQSFVMIAEREVKGSFIRSSGATQPWYPKCFARNLFVMIVEREVKG